MCVEVAIRTNGKEITAETKAQLREALGIEPIMLTGYTAWPDDACLCPCDIDETAAAAGFAIQAENLCRVAGQFTDFVLTRNECKPS